jgi:uncharacterized repeat protein (TIGR02543 family)
MKRKSLPNLYFRILSFILCFALLQGSIAVPAFADEDTYDYILRYEESDCITVSTNKHAILIPDEDLIEGEDPSEQFTYDNYDANVTPKIGEPIPDWGSEPYRILGYTFMGWYTKENGKGTKIEKDTPITKDLLDEFDSITLYAYWKEYQSPDITSNSLTISAKNAKSERLSDVTFKDEDGNVGISSDKTEYTTDVFRNVEYLTLNFEQYEPEASVSVTCNGKSIALDDSKREEITQTGYAYYENGTEQILTAREVVTGVKLATVEDAIQLDQDTNVIEITVSLPGDNPVSTKTYTITINRLNAQLSPNYGNTPYGRIMTYGEAIDTQKEKFNTDYTYRNNYYSPNAWNPYGSAGVEVVKGSTLSGTQYINYDKDDTAIVVYSGDSFTDPGIELYDESGEAVTLSDSKYVTRTINYEASDSLKFEDWNNTTSKTYTTKLTGNDSDYVVDLLEKENVKPGVYKINYSYDPSDGGKAVTAERNMIVLPKLSDLNMDNYINALDAKVYDKTITADSIANCLYLYRALDLNADGEINDTDKTLLKNGKNATKLYTSLSVEKSVSQTTYTVPTEADDNLAQLYMEYLGNEAAPAETKADDSDTLLDKGDIFWIGYRFDNVANLGTDLKSLTLTVNYDSRYISPNVSNLSELISTIKTYNPNIAALNIEGTSTISGTYSVDSSTAACTWSDTSSVKTLKLEMYINDGSSYTLEDGYFVKLPFSVLKVPPTGRNVISTALGANTLNMNVGGEYGLMWDTSDSLNSVTENLMSKLQYMGDYAPKFGKEADAIELADMTYGVSKTITKKAFSNGSLTDGELPDGITYNASMNTLSGTPTEVGTFEFYINGVKYSLTVNKADLHVTADDKTKTYGDDNPELTFQYDESDLKNGDTIADAVQTAPSISCAADKTSDYLSETDIVLSGGKSTNYNLVLTNGTLTVNAQKEIEITAISKIPDCAGAARWGEFPYTINTTATDSEYTATGILAGDKVMISYGVEYTDGDEGSQTVNITNPSTVTDNENYPDGNNYKIVKCITTATGHVSSDTVQKIQIRAACTLEYTYGEPLDLNGGTIIITYASGGTQIVTFKEAQELGFRIRYRNRNKEANDGDKLTVDYTGENLIVDYPSDTSVVSRTTSNLTINKKDLHVKADDKSRYYGDDNSTVNFTYTFADDFVYGDGKATGSAATQTAPSGFVAPTFSCGAVAGTEIDKENGYTNAEIVLSGGSADNYNIVCESGTLTINKRPLKITKILSGVPALTAKYYMDSTGAYLTAPYDVEASAIAGGDETATMTVTGLYNDDPVKITYNARYANHNVTNSVNVTVDNPTMDDSYGKSYNYTVDAASVTTATGGRVYARNIKAIEVTEEPTTSYIYGTPLDLETGNVHITYDSGEEYDVTFEGLKDHSNVHLKYTDTGKDVTNEAHLTVADSGRTMTLTCDSIYDDVAEFTWESKEFGIAKHELRVSADAVYTTYGNEIPTYTYTYADDFQYGETETTAVKTKPTFTAKEDDGTTDLNQKTLAGVYTLKIAGGEADNYEFAYTNSNVTIRQRPLIITSVNKVPTLSAVNAFENNLLFEQEVKTDEDSTTFTFAENQGPLWDDKVRITYEVEYPDPTVVGTTTVNIQNAVLDRTYGDVRNYYLQRMVSTASGSVDAAIITNIEMTADPTCDADGKVYEYNYGDELDLSRGAFTITFDSGRVDTDVPIEKFSDYGITMKYTGTDDEVVDGEYVTIDYHNGKSITIVPPSTSTADEVVTGSIKVNKRPMHVIVNDANYVYGDGPASDTYSISYDENDLAPLDPTIVKALGEAGTGFTPPTISCLIDGNAADEKTFADKYEDVITASGGESHNYEFVCDDTGTLTVNKRELQIAAITSGIPTLTSADVYKNNYTTPIKLDGTADNTQLTIINLANNDELNMVYKAVYNSIEQSENEPVDIEDFDFAEDCPNKQNYVLTAVPKNSSGEILTRLMSAIEVIEDPTKMEYTYGEWLRLSGGSVNIIYNSGYVEEGVTFDNLKNFGIEIYFAKENQDGDMVVSGEAKPNTLLTVPIHNGMVIKLVPSETTQVIEDEDGNRQDISTYSGPITVNKHQMRVVAEDKSMIYGGEAPTDYTWHYVTSDLVNGDSLTSSRFADSNVEPSADCLVDGAAIDSTTPAGDYAITPSGGSNDNYELVYVDGTLTVGKKDLKIKSIDNGVPKLTSDIIYQNGGTPPVKIRDNTAEYTAENQQMTVDGLINGDEIGITYSAVYTSIAEADETEINIADVEFDDTHIGNNNYVITEVPTTATGGTVREEQIINVTITDDPILRDDTKTPIQYTYGDELDLDRGAVTVEYDSGKILENMKFNEVETKTDGKVKLVYTDDDETPAHDNDVLHVSKHNGKSIKLKVTTMATVTEPTTSPITVNKAVITVTAQDDERYYGDANPRFKSTYSGFVNGDDETSANFKLDLVEPKISSDAVVKSPIGTYDIVISGGSAANYSFVYVPATLTVVKRPLDIKAIVSGVPSLTSDIINANPQLVHKLDGTAINTAGQLSLENLSSGDDIRITYTAVYTSITAATNVVVNIDNLVLDESYGDGSNYVLRDIPSIARCGTIYDKEISLVEIVTQPRLEYTYGDTIDLSQQGVKITYDNGEVISNIAYDELADYDVELFCVDTNGDKLPAEDVGKLNVPLYNGAYLLLVPKTALNNIPAASTRTLTVNKKAVDVNVKSVTSVYGDDPTAKFEFDYDESDLEYGETLASSDFTDTLTAPTFVCLEKDGKTTVSGTSNVGNYTISLADGSQDNYRFVYHNATLTITKRPLTITAITGGIPSLTSAEIFENPGQEHRLDATADNTQMTFTNDVNNDLIRIKYQAVYVSEESNTTCDVGIEYISMDDSYGNSANYEIDASSISTVKNGGTILDKEITEIEILEQPKLNYTYGDTLDLSEGKVKITYDSGFTEEVGFDELADHRISLAYTDGSNTATNANGGDVLTVPEHNGKKIKLSARSTNSVEPKFTDAMTVEKLVLEYGDCIVNPIEYDGETTATTGTIKFANPQNGDKVTAVGTFTFEDSNAGKNKTVYITDVVLDDEFTDNYELPSDNLTASGEIQKSEQTVALSDGAVTISDVTNTITITPPDMTETQINGGAEYEYSIDGGNTWQKSNVFENLPLGLDCDVRIRFAETDNYAQSEPSDELSFKTYLNKLTLIAKNEEATVLRSFYTNVLGVENDTEFKNLVGDVGVTYYQCYTDAEGKTKVSYPMLFAGDVTIYASLTRTSTGGLSSGGGGGKSGATSTPTVAPTTSPNATPSTTETPTNPIPTSTEVPEATAVPTLEPSLAAVIPYISGYHNEVRPEAPMTRAEVTKIVSVISGGFDKNATYPNSYSDVDDYFWYYNYIGYASDNAWVKGYLDGCFYPENTITRAEFAAIIARYLGAEPRDGAVFSDTAEETWSTGYINALADMGILKGYIDGSFHPENDITRAEGVTLVNRMINLVPDKAAIDELVCPFDDLDKSHWAYYDIMTAACEY